MKKIISLLILATIIFVMANGVFAHQGKTDSYGGHCVIENGYITAYHFHQGKLMGYEIVLADKMRYENIEQLKTYIKTLNLEQIAKLGTIRKMSSTATATPNQTITPSATATSTVAISKTETTTPTIAVAVSTSTSKALPQTGQEPSTVLIFASALLIILGIGIYAKMKLNNTIK